MKISLRMRPRGAAQRMRLVQRDAAGIDRTKICGIGRKIKHATITAADRIAVALGCRLGDLLD